MDLRLKIFSRLPRRLQVFVTHAFIRYRALREWLAAIRPPQAAARPDGKPRVVFVTGFPRTGTTVLKYHFGEYPGLRMTKFDPSGFYVPWRDARHSDDIVIDKSNHYIRSVNHIFKACGEQAAVCCIVRDPRDSLLSLLSFPEAREIPRDVRFWAAWQRQYDHFLSFAARSGLGHRMYLLRYEDFVQHPGEAKRDFLEWLGMDLGLAEITGEYTIPFPDEVKQDKVHQYRAIQQAARETWRHAEMDEATRQLIEGWRTNAPAAELMRSLGYTDGETTAPTLTVDGLHLFRPAAAPRTSGHAPGQRS